jgi:uncharacterized protein YdiU (UPF0061 family)
MAEIKKLKSPQNYQKIEQIDGSHPLKKILPRGFVDYPARLRRGGKVAYFNFQLAKEMGIISKGHEEELNPELIEKLISTFGIVIINEFDKMKGKKFKESDMKAGTYMATRYLQLQHDDKKGFNSGDGRSVWMGHIKNKKQSWDVSACGTGATRLSPATSKFNKFFETGDPSISYGCGYAELDEGLATSLMSHIFNENNIKTEQTLCIIQYKDDYAVNVRAHTELLRPSHFFLHLKQDDLESLTNLADYYIERKRHLSSWETCPTSKKKYDFFLQKIVEDFATMSAVFEDEYIFCWMDWDGDNILMDGGIIDYGSIRQFGVLHHEYRYDDVERFSTSILEQKSKARYMVQNFIQLVQYLKTGVKPSLSSLSEDSSLVRFDESFEEQKNLNILNSFGFSKKKAKQVLKRNKELVVNFRKAFSHFEKAKSKAGIVKVADGVNCDAVFNMRNMLRELPQIFLSQATILDDKDFIEIMSSSFATADDLELTSYRKTKIKEFQQCYLDLIHFCAKTFQEDFADTLLDIVRRSGVINKPNRLTGDAATHIVALLMEHKDKQGPEQLYQLIQQISMIQNLDPDTRFREISNNPKGVMKKVLDIIKENREGI